MGYQKNKLTIRDLHTLMLDRYGIDIPEQIINYYKGDLIPFKQEEENSLWELESDLIEQAEKVLLLQYIGLDKEDILNYTDEKMAKRVELIERVVKVLKGMYKGA